jgi:transposase
VGEVAGGREALVAEPRGRRVGEHQLLSEAEQQAIRQAVLDHRPSDLGLAGQLWTQAGVRDLITKLYRVRLTEQGVGKYLRRWGLSFQRPDKRAVEQDAEAMRVWREETWSAIHAKAEGGEVPFADQVGIRSDQVTGRTWGERGRTTASAHPMSIAQSLETKRQVNARLLSRIAKATGSPAYAGKTVRGPSMAWTQYGINTIKQT